jgi:sugar/nucleoside kinase (ribokinase family)
MPLAGVDPPHGHPERLLGSHQQDELLASRDGRVQQISLKHARGALGELLVGPDGKAFVRSMPVDVMDTTAAGDVFNGAFACALGRGTSPEDAVRQACIAAALSMTRLGVRPSLPTTDAFRRFEERH